MIIKDLIEKLSNFDENCEVSATGLYSSEGEIEDVKEVDNQVCIITETIPFFIERLVTDLPDSLRLAN